MSDHNELSPFEIAAITLGCADKATQNKLVVQKDSDPNLECIVNLLEIGSTSTPPPGQRNSEPLSTVSTEHAKGLPVTNSSSAVWLARIAVCLAVVIGIFLFWFIPNRIGYARDSADFERCRLTVAKLFDLVSEDIASNEIENQLDIELARFNPTTVEFARKKEELLIQKDCVKVISLAKNGEIAEADRMFAQMFLDSAAMDKFTVFTQIFVRFAEGMIRFHEMRKTQQFEAAKKSLEIFADAKSLATKLWESGFSDDKAIVMARLLGQRAMVYAKVGESELAVNEFNNAETWLQAVKASTKLNSIWWRAYCRIKADEGLVINRVATRRQAIDHYQDVLDEIKMRPELTFQRGLLLNNLADVYTSMGYGQTQQNMVPEELWSFQNELKHRNSALTELRSAYTKSKTQNISQNYSLALTRLAILHVHGNSLEKMHATFSELYNTFPEIVWERQAQISYLENIELQLIAATCARIPLEIRIELLELAFRGHNESNSPKYSLYLKGCSVLLSLPSCPQNDTRKAFANNIEQMTKSNVLPQ